MTAAIKKTCAFLLILPILLLLLTSCQSSYRDLDNIVFVTSILVDQDDENNLVFYFETLNSVRNSSKESNKEERIVYKIKCRNAGDALNQLEAHSSAPVTMSHNKIILFTEKFAQSGLDNVFDMFDRWQESINRALLGIFVGDTKDFVEPEHPEDEITGLYLYGMLDNKQSLTSVGVKVDIKEFMNQKYVGDKLSSVPIINVSEDEDTKGQYYLDGLALVKEYKMVGRLDSQQSLYFHLLINNEISGNISVQNPEQEDRTISLMLQRNQYDSDVEFQDGVLKVTRKLKLITNISAVQGRLELTEDTVKKIEDAMAEKIKKNCLKLFEEWKNKEIDIFDIQEEFEVKYPSEKGKNIIENSELVLDVQVKISGTTTIKDAE